MAKGIGWMMAIGAGLMSDAKDWYAAVIAAAGLDPRVCPMCGFTFEYEWNGAVWCCRCFASPAPTKRADIVLTAAHNAKADNNAKADIWAFEDPDPILWLVDGAGEVVAGYVKGRHNPIWEFSIHIGVFEKPEDFPPLPEGLHVEYPSWWPQEALRVFGETHAAELLQRREAAKVESRELGVKFGRERRTFSGASEWDKTHCEVCGESDCPGATTDPWAEVKDPPCKHSDELEERLVLRWEGLVKGRKAHLEAAVAEAEKAKADQAKVDSALATAGFYDGRLGLAALPEGVVVIRRDSMGDRSDPHLLVASPKLNLDQLRALVQARGDFSEVQIHDGKVCILSPNPGNWIGREGSTIKALSKALGRFIKVEKK